MLGSIIKYSTLILVTLMILGCVSESDDKSPNTLQNSTKAVKIADLQNFGNGVEYKNLRHSADTLSKTAQNDTNSGMCQSGSIDLNTLSFDANNCDDGYVVIDGSASAQIYPNDRGGFAQVLRDLSILDGYFSLLVKKDSQIKIDINSQNGATITTSFQTEINGDKLSVDNLTMIGMSNDNGGLFYLSTGEILIDEYYIQVDPAHDGSTTPFVLDSSGFKSGLMKLLDGAGHKIEIAVVSSDELALRVDENGDGVFSDDEIVTQIMQ